MHINSFFSQIGWKNSLFNLSGWRSLTLVVDSEISYCKQPPGGIVNWSVRHLADMVWFTFDHRCFIMWTVTFYNDKDVSRKYCISAGCGGSFGRSAWRCRDECVASTICMVCTHMLALEIYSNCYAADAWLMWKQPSVSLSTCVKRILFSMRHHRFGAFFIAFGADAFKDLLNKLIDPGHEIIDALF